MKENLKQKHEIIYKRELGREEKVVYLVEKEGKKYVINSGYLFSKMAHSNATSLSSSIIEDFLYYQLIKGGKSEFIVKSKRGILNKKQKEDLSKDLEETLKEEINEIIGNLEEFIS